MEQNWNEILTTILIESEGVNAIHIEDIVLKFKKELEENNLKIIKSI